MTATNCIIKRIRSYEDVTPQLALFFEEEAEAVSQLYSHLRIDDKTFDFIGYAERNIFFVCEINDRPVGVMLCTLAPSIFDRNCMMLLQDLLYVKSPAFNAAKFLLEHFIDFGKKNANHIVTTIGTKTNIKPRSLERLGFKKLEESYIMGVERDR